jgi:uncharacterized glyoxalase superfamily protein PhnB
MKLQEIYPVVITDKLRECRDFYCGWFGFQVMFEASWFVYLTSVDEQPKSLAFMSSDHPSQPPGADPFSGKGLFLTFQVEDAAAEFARLHQAGLEPDYPLHDEPWGQRRFGLRDPAGLWIDVVQQIDPAPGYWQPYLTQD